MSILSFRRRDPWWGQEGPAARRRHRYERFMSTTAFVASVFALGGAAWVWAVHLGFVGLLGIRATLAI
jgi:hypothetical protein